MRSTLPAGLRVNKDIWPEKNATHFPTEGCLSNVKGSKKSLIPSTVRRSCPRTAQLKQICKGFHHTAQLHSQLRVILPNFTDVSPFVLSVSFHLTDAGRWFILILGLTVWLELQRCVSVSQCSEVPTSNTAGATIRTFNTLWLFLISIQKHLWQAFHL